VLLEVLLVLCFLRNRDAWLWQVELYTVRGFLHGQQQQQQQQRWQQKLCQLQLMWMSSWWGSSQVHW
jgi:hypothetical protein